MKFTFTQQPVLENKKIVPGADCVACNNGCCGTNSNRSDDIIDAIAQNHMPGAQIKSKGPNLKV